MMEESGTGGAALGEALDRESPESGVSRDAASPGVASPGPIGGLGLGGVGFGGLGSNLRRSSVGAPDLAREAMVSLHRVATLSREAGKKVFASHGVAPAAGEALITLRTFEPPHRRTPSELAAAIRISPGGLSKLLPGLEERALVVRTQNPNDRRSFSIELTESGIEVADSILAGLIANDRGMLFGALSRDEIETFTRLLSAILQHDE